MTETTDAIRYYSTNAKVPEVRLAEALLEGQAVDRELCMPTRFPAFTADDLKAMSELRFAQIAAIVLRQFTKRRTGDTASFEGRRSAGPSAHACWR